MLQVSFFDMVNAVSENTVVAINDLLQEVKVDEMDLNTEKEVLVNVNSGFDFDTYNGFKCLYVEAQVNAIEYCLRNNFEANVFLEHYDESKDFELQIGIECGVDVTKGYREYSDYKLSAIYYALEAGLSFEDLDASKHDCHQINALTEAYEKFKDISYINELKGKDYSYEKMKSIIELDLCGLDSAFIREVPNEHVECVDYVIFKLNSEDIELNLKELDMTDFKDLYLYINDLNFNSIGYLSEGYSKHQIDILYDAFKLNISLDSYDNLLKLSKENLNDILHYDLLGLTAKRAQLFDAPQLDVLIEWHKKDYDIESIANPEIKAETMNQIMKFKKDNLTFTDKMKLYHFSIIEEIRLALKAKIDIFEYIDNGYCQRQLKAIRLAKTKGFNYKLLLSGNYNIYQMNQLFDGMKNGLNVTIYADENINHETMENIKVGLINKTFKRDNYFNFCNISNKFIIKNKEDIINK
ncbi:MAG: hypothetical protein R3Y64_08285 [Peptostreptococcaceae bacterium]